MTDYIYSAVLILPAAYREAGNALAEAIGWGPDNYSIALTDNGETITHYAVSTCVDQQFADWLQNPPPEAEGAGPLLAVLIADLQPRSDDGAHARAVFAINNLTLFTEGENDVFDL